jgi:hypothetical protein
MNSDRNPDITRLLRQLPSELRSKIEDAPLSGDGVHQWLFSAALQLNRCPGLSDDERNVLLGWAVRDCGRTVPQRELNDALRNSKHLVQSSFGAKGFVRGSDPKGVETRNSNKSPKVNEGHRARILSGNAFGLEQLRMQSPVPTGQPHQNSGWYVDQLFPGDPLVCIGTSPSMCATMPLSGFKRRFRLDAHALIVPSPMSALSGTNQNGERSVRCLDNTGPRRFLITEFDRGTLDEHASLIWHLRAYAPLVMVLWSGSKSLHAWWHAQGVPEDTLLRFFRYAVSLGADASTRTRCQLVRLPEGWREDRQARQAVHYFDPSRLPRSDHGRRRSRHEG